MRRRAGILWAEAMRSSDWIPRAVRAFAMDWQWDMSEAEPMRMGTRGLREEGGVVDIRRMDGEGRIVGGSG